MSNALEPVHLEISDYLSAFKLKKCPLEKNSGGFFIAKNYLGKIGSKK